MRAALQAIGFQVTGLAGRVRWMSPPDSPLGPKTHMMLKVDLTEGAYLADAGFGACLLDAPLQLKTDVEQTTSMGTYRLTQSGRPDFAQTRNVQGGWRTMYVFDLQPQIQSDYELGNWFTSTNPIHSAHHPADHGTAHRQPALSGWSIACFRRKRATAKSSPSARFEAPAN